MSFKDLNMNEMQVRMHYLNTDDSQKDGIKLNSKQLNFMKRYLKFQARFLKKLLKDNKINDGYLIIVPVKGAGYANSYLLLTKNVFYYVKEGLNSLYRYRILNERFYLEFALYPSPAFMPTKVETYLTFFSELFTLFKSVMSYPSQFVVATKDGVSSKGVDHLVQFAQIQKYL